jgi:hypothetical protein
MILLIRMKSLKWSVQVMAVHRLKVTWKAWERTQQEYAQLPELHLILMINCKIYQINSILLLDLIEIMLLKYINL